MTKENHISCPDCGAEINVENVLEHQVQKKLEQKFKQKELEFESKVQKKREEYSLAQKNLLKQQQEFENQKNEFEEKVATETRKKLNEEKIKLTSELTSQIKSEINKEYEASKLMLEEELKSKSLKLQELNSMKVEVEKLKREKNDLKTEIELESQRKLTEELALEREKIKKQFILDNEMKLKQKDEQMNQLKKQLDIAQKKAETVSQQLQGEVQELAIEDYLSFNFPIDEISEIKKGANGADCFQIVKSRYSDNCGKIYYESKRTKDFNKNWITKLKDDMKEINADIGVIVTQTMPKELDRMGLIDGVWICTFDEFKGLSYALRETLLKVEDAREVNKNKTTKMSLVYDYLSSNEFKLQIESIVNNFKDMKESLESEKRSMNRIWKTREKQIETVLSNTIGIYGSIKGIGGNSIENIEILELDYSNKAS